MSNNQRSTGFLAIRYTLAAIMVGVFFGLTAIGTEAQRVSTATRGDRSAVKEQPATVNAPAVAFTPGNLAVVQMGDGVAVLSGNAAPVSVLEYTPAGVLVQTIAIPSGAISPRLVVTGSSGSEGHIVRSSNGGFLTLTASIFTGSIARCGLFSSGRARRAGRRRWPAPTG